MNGLIHLAASPAAQVWGEALLHFVWQGALWGALAWAALRGIGESRPRLRYAVACLFLALMAAAPFFTVAVSRSPVSDALVLPPPVGEVKYGTGEAGAAAAPAGWRAWAFALWCLGACFFLVRAAGGWWLAWTAQRRGRLSPPAEWLTALERVASRLRVAPRIRFHLSEHVSAPQVFGYLRPVVLFPVAAVSGLSLAQVEAILAHELAHIARYDLLVNYLQVIVESLLFYHPAVWWLSRRIREEREACCDAIAAGMCGDRAEYGRALLAFEEARRSFALAATSGGLAARTRRLLSPGPGRPEWLLAVLTCALAGGMIAYSQQPKPAPAPAKPAAPAAGQPAAPPVAKPSPLPARQQAAAFDEIEKQIQALRANLVQLLEKKVEADQKRYDFGVIPQEELVRSRMELARARRDTDEVRALAQDQLERTRREVELGAASPLELHSAQAELARVDLERQLQQSILAKERELARSSRSKAEQQLSRQKQELLEMQLEREAKALQEAHERAAERELEALARRREEEIQAVAARQERKPPPPYSLWLDQDVRYIIRPEERLRFELLGTNEEREKFIEQFWAGRDRTPGTAENEVKEEHYRRIAYANERFGSAGRAGWKTDRGRVYIVFGPPDTVESSPEREVWLYRNGTRYEFTGPARELKGVSGSTSRPGPG